MTELYENDASARETFSLHALATDTEIDIRDTALLPGPQRGRPNTMVVDCRDVAAEQLDALCALAKGGPSAPALLLVVVNEPTLDEARLMRQFVEVGDGVWTVARPVRAPEQETQLGELMLRFDISRAFWRGADLALTLTEFRILALLVRRAGEHVAYREIYDVVHGKDFRAGDGPEGYRANVRTFIKRIRGKFWAIDGGFDRIENFSRFGYRWLRDNDTPRAG